MASSTPFPQHPGGPGETLAEALKRGPLPLAPALRCGTEVAKILSDLHQRNQAYGKVAAASVLLRSTGAELLPSRSRWAEGGLERDVARFGALLFEMIVGTKPPVDATAATFRMAGPASGVSGIRAAVLRLAGKCLGHVPVKPTMQQAATEVRLLWVVARQFEAAGMTETRMAAPFLVSPPAGSKAKHAPGAPSVVPEASDTDANPLVPLDASDFNKGAPRTVAKLEPDAGHCPKCDSVLVYTSRPRSRFERLLVRWQVPICRCHRCYHRYVVVARMRIGKEMPVGVARRFKPRQKRRR